MREPKRRQNLKAWELETGIKIIEPRGFTNWDGKSRIWTNLYTKDQFRRGIGKSMITVKFEKGLEFMKQEMEHDDVWRNYVHRPMRERNEYRKR